MAQPPNNKLDFEWLAEVGVAWGLPWARRLARAITEGDLIDMGSIDLFAPCPLHPGRNIAYHSCDLCGYPQAALETCREMVHRWAPAVKEDTPVMRPGQLTFDSQSQLELAI